VNKQLTEKRNELRAKSEKLAAIFQAANTDKGYDFTKVEEFKDLADQQACVEKIRELNQELADLGKQVDELAELDGIEARAQSGKDQGGIVHPPSDSDKTEVKSLGEMFVESAAYKAWRDNDKQKEIPAEINDFEVKVLFQTTAGWAPESIRTGRVVDAVTRPIQALDLIPQTTTGMAAVVYMEETTRTHVAAEVAEAGTYAEATFALTERTSNVRKIGTSIPVTDEQLEDVAQVQGYLNNRLTFGLRQRLDLQVITGDGIAPNLTGILNVTGIQTTALGAEPVFDALYRAARLVRVTGRAQPSGYLLHPNDWEAIRLTRTADGIYILGNPADSGPERMWGLPVAQGDVITENTGLVGDFRQFSEVAMRRGVVLKITDSHATDFLSGQQRIRADIRAAFPVYRPAAFCTITGI